MVGIFRQHRNPQSHKLDNGYTRNKNHTPYICLHSCVNPHRPCEYPGTPRIYIAGDAWVFKPTAQAICLTVTPPQSSSPIVQRWFFSTRNHSQQSLSPSYPGDPVRNLQAGPWPTRMTSRQLPKSQPTRTLSYRISLLYNPSVASWALKTP